VFWEGGGQKQLIAKGTYALILSKLLTIAGARPIVDFIVHNYPKISTKLGTPRRPELQASQPPTGGYPPEFGSQEAFD
jgi:hypothetical protein